MMRFQRYAKAILTSLGASSLLLMTLATSSADDDEKNTAILKIKFQDEKYEVQISLYPEDAPQTVTNFKKLVKDDFYEDTTFHRVIPGFIVQGGDPNSRDPKNRAQMGLGGPGYTIPAEIKRLHTRGAVAMARLGDAVNPEQASNGSQFYIALNPLPELDGAYTVFGQVVSGMEVFDEMARVSVDSNDNPIQRVEILSIKLKKGRLDPVVIDAPAPQPVAAAPAAEEYDDASSTAAAAANAAAEAAASGDEYPAESVVATPPPAAPVSTAQPRGSDAPAKKTVERRARVSSEGGSMVDRLW